MRPDLNRELVLLAKVSDLYGIPTARVAERLIAWESQPLPDVLPPCPEWVKFQWPKSGVTSFSTERYEVDWKNG